MSSIVSLQRNLPARMSFTHSTILASLGRRGSICPLQVQAGKAGTRAARSSAQAKSKPVIHHHLPPAGGRHTSSFELWATGNLLQSQVPQADAPEVSSASGSPRFAARGRESLIGACCLPPVITTSRPGYSSTAATSRAIQLWVRRHPTTLDVAPQPTSQSRSTG
jgi:hypothetical protein